MDTLQTLTAAWRKEAATLRDDGRGSDDPYRKAQCSAAAAELEACATRLERAQPRRRPALPAVPRRTWQDELNRWQYVSGKLDDLLTAWDTDAAALAGDASGREGPEGRAAGRELARAAEELRGTLGASAPPGWDQPGHLEFARWHLAEMHAHLRAARDQVAADLKDAKGPVQ